MIAHNESLVAKAKRQTTEMLDYLKHVYEEMREQGDEGATQMLEEADETAEEMRFELRESFQPEALVESVLDKL